MVQTVHSNIHTHSDSDSDPDPDSNSDSDSDPDSETSAFRSDGLACGFRIGSWSFQARRLKVLAQMHLAPPPSAARRGDAVGKALGLQRRYPLGREHGGRTGTALQLASRADLRDNCSRGRISYSSTSCTCRMAPPACAAARLRRLLIRAITLPTTAPNNSASSTTGMRSYPVLGGDVSGRPLMSASMAGVELST